MDESISVCLESNGPLSTYCRGGQDDYGWEAGRGDFLVQKEMGIQRRKRRSIHGRELHAKSNSTTLDKTFPSGFYAPCLELSEENLISAIIEDCTNVEDIIYKLKEQTISLAKKRCIKAKLKPAHQSKILKLSCMKKIKYKFDISYNKLKIGIRNFLYTCELWYSSLKVIEGKFGSSVATYFKLLRKFFILNCIIFVINFFFIILPQGLYDQFLRENNADGNASFSELKMDYVSGESSDEYDVEENFFFFPTYSYSHSNKLRLGNLFTGMGYLSDSVLFYGHYLNTSFSLSNGYAYDMPSAYFFSTACCYFLVLCVLFFSVADSYKKCYIETSNGRQNVFADKIFCGWDFGIAKPYAEELKYCSIHMELKELLHESDLKTKRNKRFDWFYTLMIRVSLNLIIALLFLALGWYTNTYLDIHMDNADKQTIMMLSLTLTLVTTLAPVGFSLLSKIEFYECPRTALYATVIRTFILHTLIIILVVAHRLNSASKMVCWETIVGQDMHRLVVLDFFVGVGDSMVEFIRMRINKKWKKIERPEFNIALNTMNLIYNQALLYIGLYFSPGLSLIVCLKMLLTFYLKKWGAMYNCQPSKKPWRAAQMQTVFLSFAFLVFFGVIVTYGYIFNSVKTSWCGPFGGGKYVFQAVLYEILHDGVNSTAVLLLSHFLRSGVSVILLIAMILAIYYLRTVNSVRRRIVKNLRHIVKEQVAHKKKLLTRIHKAQEDFKNDFKRNNSDRKRKISAGGNNILRTLNKAEDSSDADDNGEDMPLRGRLRHLKDSNIIRLRGRLCNSSYNLGDLSKSSEKLSKSLQNLSPEFCLSEIETNTKVLSSENVSTSVECGQEENKISNSTLSVTDHKQNHHRNKEDFEMTPIQIEPESTPIRKSRFSYDERVPSRIYFGRNKKGGR